MLAAFGALSAVVFFEIAFRIFAPMLAAPKWRDLPSTYYMPEQANPVGDYLYSEAKPPNTYRIVVIGDSFTHGGTMQMFDTFPKRIERYLNLNVDQPHVEVINYSKPGVATVHELTMVRRALEHFQPDMILLEITLNDPEPKPYRSTHKYQDEKGKIVLENPIFRIWKSLAFIVQRVYATKANAEYVEYFRGIFRDERNWSGFCESLQKMKKMADERHVTFATMIFPLFSFPFNERYPFNAEHEKIHTALTESSIPYLDLLSSYKNVPPDRLQAIPYENPHPNEIANRIAADELVKWFAAEKLVPFEILPKNTGEDRPQIRSLYLELGGESEQDSSDTPNGTEDRT